MREFSFENLNNFRQTNDFLDVKYYINIIKGRYYIIAVYKVVENSDEVVFIRQAFDKYGEIIRDVKDIYTKNDIKRVNRNLIYTMNNDNEILNVIRNIHFNSIIMLPGNKKVYNVQNPEKHKKYVY